MADKNENVLVEEKLPPPISLDKMVYSSEPFKFLVEGTPFYVHGNLLSKHSKALAACLSNPMKEKDQGFAVLEDVSESTFNHLLEWMYQDFYTVPAPIKVVKKKEIKENPEQQDHKLFPMDGLKSPEDEARLEPRPSDVDEIDLSWGDFGTKKSKKARKTTPPTPPKAPTESRTDLREAFLSRPYKEYRSFIPIPPAKKNENDTECYEDIFLCHAKLYVFAEKWLIPQLKILALENLHETLKNFKLYPSRTGDVVALLRHVYEHTSSPLFQGLEPMRKLLTEYIGFEMDTLIKDRDFQILMIDDGGDLLGDFMSMVLKRI